MRAQAISKNVKISPRKVRLVAEVVCPLSVESALVALKSMRKRAAYAVAKTLQSAVANALQSGQVDKNNLCIISIDVSDGQALKRYHASTRGRTHPYKRRASHIRVVLEERKKEDKK